MSNYSGIFKIRIQFYALVFLYLSFILSTATQACCCGSEPFCSPFSCLISHDVFPLETESAGGPNTIDNPTIGIHISRCNFYSTEHHTLTMHSGDIKSSTGSAAAHTYYAQIESNSKVCDPNSECAYINACSTKDKTVPPLNISCSGTGPSANCDPQVASITINMCNAPDSNGNKINKMVGICAYVSNDTGYETALNEIFTTGFIAAIAIDPVVAMIVYLSDPSVISTKPSGFSPLGCYPVPVAPLPPPFCKESFSASSSVSILRICAEGEEPFKKLSSSTKECVKPLSNMKSTFMHPCVRVTFDNPVQTTAISYNTNSDYYNYYTTDWKEILYTLADGSDPDTKLRYTSLYDASTGTTSNPSSSLTAFGINDVADSDYADICGDVNTDGSITASLLPITDPISGSPRSFTLALPCPDPSDTPETCSTTEDSEDRFKKTQICVYEKKDDKEVLQSCVDRPEMDKPKVSFCDDTFNDKTSSCMKVTAATSENTTADYTFKGSMGTCTDTAEKAQQLCVLNADNPFGFQAILTNRCYINMVSIQQINATSIQDGDIDKIRPLCYTNSSSCTSQDRNGCTNCFIDEYCGKLGADSTTSEVTGAERLCLSGYTDIYTSLSPEWCKDDQKNSVICNRVCANVLEENTPDKSYQAYIDIGNRTTPTTEISSPLTESCSYSKSSSQYTYRVRNPVEEGLCVDAYTINFKECQGGQTEKDSSSKLCKDMKSFCSIMKIPQKANACKKAFDKACTSKVTFPTELCNNVKDYCSTTTEDNPNHYEHFDDCQAAFKYCLANPTSTTKKQLGTDITYTCTDLSQIVSSS